jgi:DNA mismatch repair protein MSH3
MYTQATLVGEDVGEGFDGGVDTNLLCLLESKKGDAVEVALLSVACATGNMVYDLFVDDLSRASLATRLAHLDPAELILPLSLSDRTEKLLNSFMQSRAQECRQERLADDKFASTHAMAVVADFFDDEDKGDVTAAGARAKGQLLQLPPLVLQCAAALLDHLKVWRQRVLATDRNESTLG